MYLMVLSLCISLRCVTVSDIWTLLKVILYQYCPIHNLDNYMGQGMAVLFDGSQYWEADMFQRQPILADILVLQYVRSILLFSI